LQHDNQARISAWASYTLNREQALTCASAHLRFRPDPDLRPEHASQLSDYSQSGLDMGHLVPNAHVSWHAQAQRESFYLSNVVPQWPRINRGVWRVLESHVRNWAYQRQHVIVYVGPVYDRQTSHTLGANRIPVPTAFYMIVTDPQSESHVAFLVPHAADSRVSWYQTQTTVHHIQHVTGIQFPVQGNIHQTHRMWQSDTSEFTQHRAQVCNRPR